MNKLRRCTIIGTIFVILTGTISHFIYGWSDNNFILGLLCPVNESTWEHMKLCFFPMLLYSFYMNAKIKSEYPGVASSLMLGILLGTFLIPAIFYTYSGILGQNFLPLDIATFIISVLLAFTAVFRFSLSGKLISYTGILKFLVFIVAVCFFIFTYCPPDIEIFISPVR